MNMRFVVPVVALVVVVVIVIMSSVFTVHQTEKALVLQFGKPVREIPEPGLQFKVPLLQNVVYYDNRILDVEPPQEEVIAADQKRLVVDSYARYRIADPLQFYQLVQTEAVASTRLASIINSALRRVIGNVQLASVVAEKRAAVMQQVRDEVNAQARSWGMDVIDVRIKRADLPAENSDAIFQRMKTERQREAAQFRGEGKREAQKIHASADRQVVEIKAEAQKRAEILRGAGDAESIRIYADAFNHGTQTSSRSTGASRPIDARSPTATPLSCCRRTVSFSASSDPPAARGSPAPRRPSPDRSADLGSEMQDFATALALMLVIEGIVLALVPDAVKRAVVQMIAVPSATLRLGGLAATCLGVAAVWLIRR